MPAADAARRGRASGCGTLVADALQDDSQRPRLPAEEEEAVMADVTAGMITGKDTVEFLRFAEEPPAPGCVSVDITLCGVCGTEIASFRNGHLHSPAVCGHEWVGTIGAVGPAVEGLEAGERVVVAVPPPCGDVSGVPEWPHRALPDGLGRRKGSGSASRRRTAAFARSVTVDAGRVLHAHPDLTDDEAAQVEPATVAFHGVRRSRITPG